LLGVGRAVQPRITSHVHLKAIDDFGLMIDD
jgi:hypothetical protein